MSVKTIVTIVKEKCNPYDANSTMYQFKVFRFTQYMATFTFDRVKPECDIWSEKVNFNRALEYVKGIEAKDFSAMDVLNNCNNDAEIHYTTPHQ